jgi:enoyl-CoA hydratase
LLFDVRDGVATVTLNRPAVLNALTAAMVTGLTTALRDWAGDERVRTIVLAGAGERGLCAGGDVRLLYEQAARCPAAALRFWREEYDLIALIARLPTPYVALMNGVVMGGGVGISAHGRHRVVNETSRVAMPEVGIGFTPTSAGPGCSPMPPANWVRISH